MSGPPPIPVGERRRWVRLCAACNNRCRFCLDRATLDGTLRPRDELLDELRAGRAEGAERAVLSGGEPTMHPLLPELIREAHDLGYRWVQIITNGRRLAYPAYFRALRDAGLDEVTFSLHGSCPRVHDAMVGVPGAFEQAIAGLRAAIASGRVVSVDVVLTRLNLADAPDLIRKTLAMGVREYDILWLTPFGAAAEHLDRPAAMFLEPRDAPAVHRVLDAAIAGGAVVWTNRLPLPFLEGYERLVQDPSKLEDELRGRRPLLDRLLLEGEPMRCREPRRCRRCPFGPFCDLLHATVAVARGERRAAIVRWDPADPAQDAALARLPAPRSAWLRADRPADDWLPASRAAVRRARRVRIEGTARVLASSLPALPPDAAMHLQPASSVRAWPRALLASPRDLIVPLTGRLLRTLDPSALRGASARLVVALPDAGAAAASGWPCAPADAARLRGWLRAAAAVEGFPPCLAARVPVRPRPEPFDLGWLDRDGRVDPMAVLRSFVAERHSARSFRCARCAMSRSCRGIPWAMARDLGLSLLRPIART